MAPTSTGFDMVGPGTRKIPAYPCRHKKGHGLIAAAFSACQLCQARERRS